MAHFAKVNEQNIVEEVIVIDNQDIGNTDFPESDLIGKMFIGSSLKLPGKWYQTSYNSSFRKNFASIGGKYDRQLDAFYSAKPYDAWVLDSDCKWVPPTNPPVAPDGKGYQWNNDTDTWDLIDVEL